MPDQIARTRSQPSGAISRPDQAASRRQATNLVMHCCSLPLAASRLRPRRRLS